MMLIEKEKMKLFKKFSRLTSRADFFLLYCGGATLDGNFKLDELKAIVESLEKISKKNAQHKTIPA